MYYRKVSSKIKSHEKKVFVNNHNWNKKSATNLIQLEIDALIYFKMKTHNITAIKIFSYSMGRNQWGQYWTYAVT